jgi:hypothetical protein
MRMFERWFSPFARTLAPGSASVRIVKSRNVPLTIPTRFSLARAT